MQLELFPTVVVGRLDEFTRAYIEAALWTLDQSDRRIEDQYTAHDIDLDTLGTMAAHCAEFQADHAGDIRDCRAPCLTLVSNESYAGHDFWLTRNGHGSGFWDGGWTRDGGKRLTEAAHRFGEFTLYVGDDGLIYGS